MLPNCTTVCTVKNWDHADQYKYISDLEDLDASDIHKPQAITCNHLKSAWQYVALINGDRIGSDPKRMLVFAGNEDFTKEGSV
jgi:hypothetical protein